MAAQAARVAAAFGRFEISIAVLSEARGGVCSGVRGGAA